MLSVSASDLNLDVGNDRVPEWEWSENNSYLGPGLTQDFSAKLNQVALNCDCAGCTADGPYCIIPLRFSSAYPGVMHVNGVNVEYSSVRVLYNVTYGEAFKLSEGCEWHIQNPNGIYIARIPASYPGQDVCYYNPDSGFPLDNEDSMVDAVYRLLNQTMDSDQDGIVDISLDENSMTFQTHGRINVQSLWGPAVLKLVVWI